MGIGREVHQVHFGTGDAQCPGRRGIHVDALPVVEADRACERHRAGFASAVHELDVEDCAGANAEPGSALPLIAQHNPGDSSLARP